jgi:hypothetical protein
MFYDDVREPIGARRVYDYFRMAGQKKRKDDWHYRDSWRVCQDGFPIRRVWPYYPFSGAGQVIGLILGLQPVDK